MKRNSAFASHCLSLYVSDIVRHPAKLPIHHIRIAAKTTGVPRDLLTAIALIENNRRPYYVRFMENTFFYVNLSLFALFSLPIRDVSLGLFQVRLSTAAAVQGVAVDRIGSSVNFRAGWHKPRFSRVLSAAQFAMNLMRDRSNVLTAARYIAALHRQWSQGQDKGYITSTFIWFLGEQYNDSQSAAGGQAFIPYSLVLEKVLRELSDRRSKRSPEPRQERIP